MRIVFKGSRFTTCTCVSKRCFDYVIKDRVGERIAKQQIEGKIVLIYNVPDIEERSKKAEFLDPEFGRIYSFAIFVGIDETNQFVSLTDEQVDCIERRYKKPIPSKHYFDMSYVSGIAEDGHPWTEGDEELFSSLTKSEQTIVTKWIKESLIPTKNGVNTKIDSYGLKHLLEKDTGIYMTNNQFKDAMLACDFDPITSKDCARTNRNWNYRISLRSPAFRRFA